VVLRNGEVGTISYKRSNENFPRMLHPYSELILNANDSFSLLYNNYWYTVKVEIETTPSKTKPRKRRIIQEDADLTSFEVFSATSTTSVLPIEGDNREEKDYQLAKKLQEEEEDRFNTSDTEFAKDLFDDISAHSKPNNSFENRLISHNSDSVPVTVLMDESPVKLPAALDTTTLNKKVAAEIDKVLKNGDEKKSEYSERTSQNRPSGN